MVVPPQPPGPPGGGRGGGGGWPGDRKGGPADDPAEDEEDDDEAEESEEEGPKRRYKLLPIPKQCYNCREFTYLGGGICASAHCQARAQRAWSHLRRECPEGAALEVGPQKPKKKKKKTGFSKQKSDLRAPQRAPLEGLSSAKEGPCAFLGNRVACLDLAGVLPARGGHS